MLHDLPPAAHLIGVCGSGMKALAELLIDGGWRVSGSDENAGSRTADRLRAIGVTLHAGHRAEHVPTTCERVIHSPAVPADNVERRRASELGIVQQSLPEFLGELTKEHTAVCIAGTHGKSTTTALIGWMLTQAGRAADVYCGAEVVGMDRNGWRGTRGGRSGDLPHTSFPSSSLGTHSPGSSASRLPHAGHRQSQDLFVLESCEYQNHFLRLSPQVAVLLGVEWDHVDCFASLDATIAAFAEFLRRVPADGTVVFNADCPGARAALATAWGSESKSRPRLVPFGFGQASIPDARSIRDATPATPECTPAINLPGPHNAFNALAAAVTCRELGLNWGEIDGGMRSFQGVHRRLQHLGEWRGMTLIDDYAHHPTAVARGLETLRSMFPRRPLQVVFQPHQVRRTTTFVEEFAEALSLADAVFVLPAYGARESAELDAVAASRGLVERIASRGCRARLLASLDHVATTLETDGRPGDVLVLMGAGSIERISDELTGRLRRNHAG